MAYTVLTIDGTPGVSKKAVRRLFTDMDDGSPQTGPPVTIDFITS